MSSLKKKADLFHRNFDPVKCKTSLKLAVSRLKLLRNKRDAQVKVLRRDVAQLLGAGQEESARVKVEHVIREEKATGAYELIELYCEIIVARLQIIESQKPCPIDLKEAISSIIFAQARCADLPELKDVRKHMTRKYGKDFADAASELRPGCGVSSLMVEKLSVKSPDIETKIKVLTAIAAEHAIDWKPKSTEEQLPKPKEDLLDGPSTFQAATKLTPEPAKTNFVPQVVQKQESVLNPMQPQAASTRGSSTGDSSSTDMPADSKLEGRAPEQEHMGTVHAQSEEQLKSHQQYWTTHFKDAAAAAEAAAKSAEMATQAARAAADFASRGDVSRHQTTIPDGFDLPPLEVSSKSKQSEPITRQSVQIDQRTEITESHEEYLRSESPQSGGVVRDGWKGKPTKEYYDNSSSRSTGGVLTDLASRGNVSRRPTTISDEYNQGPSEASFMSKQSEPIFQQPVQIDRRTERRESIPREYSRSENPQHGGVVRDGWNQEPKKEYYGRSSGIVTMPNSSSFQDGKPDHTPGMVDDGFHKKSSFGHVTVENRQTEEKIARNTSDIEYDRRMDTSYQYSRCEDLQGERPSRSMSLEEPDTDKWSRNDRTNIHHEYTRSVDHQEPATTEDTWDDEHAKDFELCQKEDSFSTAASQPHKNVLDDSSSYRRATSLLPSPVFVDDNARRGTKIQESLDAVSFRRPEQAAIRSNSQKEQNDLQNYDERSHGRPSRRFTMSSFDSAFVESTESFPDSIQSRNEETRNDQVANKVWTEDHVSRSDSYRSRKDVYKDDLYQSNQRQESHDSWKNAFFSEVVSPQSYSRDEDLDVRREGAEGNHGTFSLAFGTTPFEDEVVFVQSSDPKKFMSEFGPDSRRRIDDDGQGNHSKPVFDEDDCDDVHHIDFDKIPSDDENKSVRNQSGFFPIHASPMPPLWSESDIRGKAISMDDRITSTTKFVSSTGRSDAASAVFDDYGDSDHDSHSDELEDLRKRNLLKDVSSSFKLSVKSSPSHETDREVQLRAKEGKPVDVSWDSSSRGIENRSSSGRKKWDVPMKQLTGQFTRDESHIPDNSEEVTGGRVDLPSSNVEDSESVLGLKIIGGMRNRASRDPPYLRRPVNGERGFSSKEENDLNPVAENVLDPSKHSQMPSSRHSFRSRSKESIPESDQFSDSENSLQHQEHNSGGVSHSPQTRMVKQVKSIQGSARRSQLDGSEDYRTAMLSKRNRRPKNPDESTTVIEETTATTFYESKSERSQLADRNERGLGSSTASYSAPVSEKVDLQPRRSSVDSSRRTKLPITEPPRAEFLEEKYSGQALFSKDKYRTNFKSPISSSESDEEVDRHPVHSAAGEAARGSSRRTAVSSEDSLREELPSKEGSDKGLLLRGKNETGYGSSPSAVRVEMDEDSDVDRRRRLQTSRDVFSNRDLSDRRLLSKEKNERGLRSSLLNDADIDVKMDMQPRHSMISGGENTSRSVSTAESLRQDVSRQGGTDQRLAGERREIGYISRSIPAHNPELEEINPPRQPSSVMGESDKFTSRRKKSTDVESSRQMFLEQEFVNRGLHAPQRSEMVSARSHDPIMDEETNRHPQRAIGSIGEKEDSRRISGLTWDSNTRVQEKDPDSRDTRKVKTELGSKLGSSRSSEKFSAPIPESRDLSPEKETVKLQQHRVTSRTVPTEMENRESFKSSSSAAKQRSTLNVDAKLVETKTTEQSPMPPTRDLRQEPTTAPSAYADLSRTTSSDGKEEPKSSSSTSTEKTQDPPHLHKNLPRDYDSFVANFQALRANARGRK